MKKPGIIFMTIALVFVNMLNVNSQTLDEIIAKNTDAIGGKELIKSIRSISMENTIEAMGNESPSTTIIVNGKGVKTKSDFNGQSMIQCYTDKGGWTINPMSGSSDATVMPKDQYISGKSQIYIGSSLSDYAKQGSNCKLLGKEKLQNTDVFKIQVTTSDSVSTIYYIDATNYYIVQTKTSTEMMDQKMEVITKLSDYEKTDYGFVLPKTTNINFGDQFSLVIKLKKVEFNVPVDPTIFDLGNLK
jgi:hypothetical protein